MRVRHHRLVTADGADRPVGVLRRPLVDRDALVLLTRDRDLVLLQVQRHPPGLMRRAQLAQSSGPLHGPVVGPDRQAAAVVVRDVDLAVDRIDRDARHESAGVGDMGFRSRRGPLLASRTDVINEDPAIVLVAHHNQAVLRIDRHPVVDRVRVVDGPHRPDVAADRLLAGPVGRYLNPLALPCLGRRGAARCRIAWLAVRHQADLGGFHRLEHRHCDLGRDRRGAVAREHDKPQCEWDRQ